MPYKAGTFDLNMVFIEKAFVMKIILLIQSLAGVEFMQSCSASSDKKCLEIFLL